MRSYIKHILKIPEIEDDCFLYFMQSPEHLPFTIKRIYYILKSDPKFPRGYHAHKKTDQALFCMQGSVSITLDNGKKRHELILDHPGRGLFLGKMVWHEMHAFKKDTILLVLASRKFETGDYIRDYHKFLKLAHAKKKQKSKV